MVLGPLAYARLERHVAAPIHGGAGAGRGLHVRPLLPELSGLPLPNGIFNWYQGILPTWLYPFQFPVNTDPAVTVSLVGPWPLTLFAAVLVAAILVGYSAWAWRLAMAERAAVAPPDP